MYSNNPIHGAKIVSRVLGNKENFEAWYGELKLVAGRILKMREMLRAAL